MLKSLKDVDNSYRNVRVLFFGTTSALLLLTCWVVSKSLSIAQEAQQNVYIMDGGQILKAGAVNIQENRPVEAREHVKKFHSYFFTLSPDQQAINNHIKLALNLADSSASNQYQLLLEKGFYNAMIAGNVSQYVKIDNVEITTVAGQMVAKCTGVIEIVRPSSRTLRNLVTECHLRDVMRSDNNPHGFLMERWRVLNNTDIRTEKR